VWKCGERGAAVVSDDAESCWQCGTKRDAELGRSASVPDTEGTFHSVHPIATVMVTVRIGARDQLSAPDEGVGKGGVLASIYLSELSDRRLVVTAGNVLESYFSFAVDLTEDDTGTQGRAYYDRRMKEITRWYKNAMELASGVQAVLVSASATINEWDIGGSK